MLSFFIFGSFLQLAFSSSADSFRSFVLFDAPSKVPSIIKAANLGDVECRRLGVVHPGLPPSTEWQSVSVDPFQMPSKSITFVVNGLTDSDASLFQSLDSSLPQQRSKLAIYYSNFYRDLLQGRQALHETSATNVFASANDCRVANALLTDTAKELNSNAHCNNNEELSEIVEFLNKRLPSVQIECESAKCQVKANQKSVVFESKDDLKYLKELLSELKFSFEAFERSTGLSGTSSILSTITPLHRFDENTEQREMITTLIASSMSALQCGAHNGVTCSVVAVSPHMHAKRAIVAASLLKTVTKAYAFHLFLWVGLLLVFLAYSAAYCMHSLNTVTEKDPILYRNTTSTMFDNALDLQLR